MSKRIKPIFKKKRRKPFFKKKEKKDKVKELPEYQHMELYQYKAKIIRVIDADTVDAEVDMGFGITMTQRFRVNDYDAPETFRPRNEAEKIHGKYATNRAIELLFGKNISLKSTKVAGIYGRFGADIWLENGENFIDIMIREGFSKKKNY